MPTQSSAGQGRLVIDLKHTGAEKIGTEPGLRAHLERFRTEGCTHDNQANPVEEERDQESNQEAPIYKKIVNNSVPTKYHSATYIRSGLYSASEAFPVAS